ncbi:MAG TPA: hypothetical protein VKD71_06650 [Gemmataceae bacterium]|nr:hypothetical protein [Gemmataceae bacterium]
MHSAQADFRELFDLIHGKHSRPVYWYVIAPWVESHANEREWLRSFASRRGSPIPQADVEDLWRLYALGRVNETLLLGFQHGRADGTDWPGPKISPDEYVRFTESLGLTIASTPSFSPFYHEVVEVEEARDQDQPVSLVSTVWPCLMLGDMMFSRAGVRVSGGRRFVRRDVAESSTLYWAYRRKNRPFQDLSVGWGSNSQWRTGFRRDYRIGQEFLFNVDGNHDLGAPEQAAEDRNSLTRSERIELLTNRCFVITTKPHGDLWPYDDVLRIRA